MSIQLEAKTAREARSEIARRFPQGANYYGYDKNGECVIMSLVRPRGDKHYVATATRGKKAVSFTCEPLKPK